jgi:hypothetical protein
MASNWVHAAQKISNEQWRQLTSSKEYSYRKEIENTEVTFDNRTGNFLSKLFDVVIRFFESPTGKIVVIVAILSIIGYAVVRIILNEQRRLKNKKPKQEEEETDTEQILPEDLLQNNWESLLQEASSKGNTRLVVRYSYMYLLQLLQRNQFINYRAAKTNYDYYFEIKQPELKQDFRQLSRQYEWVWYGNYPLSQEKYEQFLNTFQQSLKTLKR